MNKKSITGIYKNHSLQLEPRIIQFKNEAKSIRAVIIRGSLILVVLVLFACSKSNDEGSFVVPDYKQWRKPVDEVLTYPVPGHGFGSRIIFGNDLAFSPKKISRDGTDLYTYPDGTIILKEVFSPGEDIQTAVPALTIMVKDSTSPLARSGWLYYMQPPGKPAMQIAGKMCAECHSAANESSPYFDNNPNNDFRDFIFAPFHKR